MSTGNQIKMGKKRYPYIWKLSETGPQRGVPHKANFCIKVLWADVLYRNKGTNKQTMSTGGVQTRVCVSKATVLLNIMFYFYLFTEYCYSCLFLPYQTIVHVLISCVKFLRKRRRAPAYHTMVTPFYLYTSSI